jgi:hypothetical protein
MTRWVWRWTRFAGSGTRPTMAPYGPPRMGHHRTRGHPRGSAQKTARGPTHSARAQKTFRVTRLGSRPRTRGPSDIAEIT